MKETLFKLMSRHTTLSDAEQLAIAEEIVVREYKKGTVLLAQGDVPRACYFVLKGCIRQHSIDEAGRESTSNFYTEEQAIPMIFSRREERSSEYTFTCLEDSVLVVGDLSVERAMYAKHDQLEAMTRLMIEESFGQVQEEFAAFVASSPEERFRSLLRNRPRLIDRVPQHQLASYLGMTPESLSRIKKRIQAESPQAPPR